MSENQAPGNDDNDWRPCYVVFPRRVLVADGYGVQRRWISPGRYLTRRSRSLGKMLYRFDGG
ncbi:MAG: hypothetical protein ACOY4C_09335 [Pseudomonadota bacterium]|jgi:hypothetical protein